MNRESDKSKQRTLKLGTMSLEEQRKFLDSEKIKVETLNEEGNDLIDWVEPIPTDEELRKFLIVGQPFED